MSMITEQIKMLRDEADHIRMNLDYDFPGTMATAIMLSEAADTIETLSAKLQAANMERSSAYYHGGWIPVTERLPEDEQEILFSTKTGRVHSGKYHDDDSANQWYSHKDKCRAWNNVVSAWMPLPDVYREDGE